MKQDDSLGDEQIKKLSDFTITPVERLSGLGMPEDQRRDWVLDECCSSVWLLAGALAPVGG